MGSTASDAGNFIQHPANSLPIPQPLKDAIDIGGNPISNAKWMKEQGGAVAGDISGNGGILGQEGDGPKMPNIQQGTSVEDVQRAQQGATNSLQSQQALLQALQNQNGLGMQNNAANNYQNTMGQYQNIANGQGPNPAMAMLNQETGRNVANQAALMAGQRGAGANVGLLARQAGQQGAAAQQQAVGQGATMQANQSLNALQGLTGVQQAYGNMANQVAGQQIGQVNANTQANLANQQAQQNALQGINNANVSGQTSVNAGNVELSKANTAAKQNMLGGIMQGLGSMFGAAKGGMVHMADGGVMNQQAAPTGPASGFGQFMASDDNQKQAQDMANKQYDYGKDAPAKSGGGMEDLIPLIATVAMMAAKGGVAKEGGPVKAKAPSQKAEQSGNSYSNDKIPAMLSEGEIVLPRTVTQSKDPTAAAAKFVAQVLARKKVRK